MAKLSSIGTGNFTTAGTWGVIDPTLFANSETSTLVCPTAYSNVARSAQFTPGAITITHIGFKLANRTGTTGTLTGHLADSAHNEIAGTAVTINTADLPVAATADLNGGFHFMKLASPVTLAAATLYEGELKTSSATQISVFGSAATNGMSIAVITSTTQAPAAGDDFFIGGEYTGAGTSNSFAVTNDNTTTTDYGAASTSLVTPAIAISNKGTFKFGTSAATNYYLKVSGNIVGYSGGEWDSGASGAEIPRDSTATIHFDCVANVDFGFTGRHLFTVKSNGLSRTSGKNVVQTLANATVTQKTSTVQITAASPGVVTWTSNTLSNGDTIQFSSLFSITGLSTFTTYYVVNKGTDGTDKFRLSLTKGGADINTGGSTNGSIVAWATSTSSLTVVADTGWKSGDTVAIASTTRTRTDCETSVLTSDAGASSLSFVDAMVYGHGGVAPVQAEVVLLTRNVVFQGASATAQAYINLSATTIASIYWTEFKWMGSNTGSKRGIETGCTTGTQDFQYNSMHNFEVTGARGFSMTGASGTGLTFSNNVMFKIADASIINVANSGSSVFDSNTCVYGTGSVPMMSFADAGSTITNNRAASQGNVGIQLSETNATIGTFSGNVSHGHASAAFNCGSIFGTMSSLTAWRTNGSGITLGPGEVVINGMTSFGNTTSDIQTSAGGATFATFYDGIFAGDTTFATQSGILFNNNGNGGVFKFYNSTFGVATGIYTTHTTGDIVFSVNTPAQVFLYNTTLGSATEISGQTSLSPTAIVGAEKLDQTAGLHKSWKRYGTITIETTTTHTGGFSVKLTPNNASFKLESSGVFGGFKVAVANGATVTPSVYVYEDATYNGNRARLIVKRNDAMGITADTVLDTATASSDLAWEQLTGTTAAVTDDGTLEFVVDCDGTAGNLFCDSFSA